MIELFCYLIIVIGLYIAFYYTFIDDYSWDIKYAGYCYDVRRYFFESNFAYKQRIVDCIYNPYPHKYGSLVGGNYDRKGNPTCLSYPHK